MRARILMAAVAMAAAALAHGADKSPSAAFMEEAMQGNLWEVQAGQLARDKAASAEVREFGATLNSQHGDAMRKSVETAQALGLTAPNELSAKHKAKYQSLSKLSAERFDEQFIAAMIEDHKQDIAKYEKQASQGNDAAAAYAKQTLPTLRSHLQMAESLK